MNPEVWVYLLGCAVWGAVVIRAVRAKVDLVVLALVLVVLGLLGSSLLAHLEVLAAGAWSFMATGLALMVLWPRHE